MRSLRRASVIAAILGAPAVGHAQIEDVSGATLRFMRGEGAPTIAQELYRFQPDGWINCRTRESKMPLDCWRLTSPRPFDDISLLEPEKADFLTKIAEQIGPDGRYRSQAETILRSAGFTGGDLDAAFVAGELAWSTNMDWANVLQVRLGDSHIFYVAFYAEHEGSANVPVDGAIVPYPGHAEPQQERRFIDSKEALAFREAGDYARCGQKALLDAGYDPSGVDGAPGGGARKALAAWADENDIAMPPFTRETASQVCYVLTAEEPHHADLSVGTMVGYPGAGWNGWTNKSGGLHDFSGIDVAVRFDGEIIKQIDALNFGPGIIYRYEGQDGKGNQINQELESPWPIVGTVFTPGNDKPRAKVLFELMQRDSIGALNGVIDGQAGGYRGLQDDLYHRPDDIDARWSVIGNFNGADVVVLDALPTRNDPAKGRVVIVFTDDGNGGGQLLYGWHNRIIAGQVEISK